jgi:hypothetical protein
MSDQTPACGSDPGTRAPLFWLSDRSAYETGLQDCLGKRYFRKHAGPQGFGIVPIAESMPQVTGKLVHAPIAGLLRWAQQHGGEDPTPHVDGILRPLLVDACAKYRQVVDARGLPMTLDADRLQTIVQEQTSLLTGLVWCWALEVFPWFHQRFRVLSIEEESSYVLGCTCGLGEGIGTWDQHHARGCHGVGLLSRLDAVTEERQSPGVVAYHEFKTTGMSGDYSAEQWETKVQFALGLLTLQQRYGVHADQMWVHCLFKGKHEATEWDPVTRKKSGPKIQNSPLCYGWRQPANLPMTEERWAPSYDYVGEDGKAHKLGKAFQRTPVWQGAFPVDPEQPPAEWWVRNGLTSSQRQAQLQVLGPLNRQRELIDTLAEEFTAHELEWQARMADLQALQAQGFTWDSVEFQRALSQLVPRSWDCRKFGTSYECPYAPICFRQQGWTDPLDSGRYRERTPHHADEARQLREAGYVVPADEWEDEDA